MFFDRTARLASAALWKSPGRPQLPFVTRLALAAAARLVRETIALDPAGLVPIVADLLTRARRAKRAVVRVAPGGVARVRELVGAGHATEVVADDALGPGDCVIETDVGTLDARLSVQVDALAEAIDRRGRDTGEAARADAVGGGERSRGGSRR